ncbi:hypothetical protein [Acanthopleuribacter pedis]|uniref:Uncharacterized protein n=1 Tax=Acanthopleuribacter pedis TaxID=442870 RepID=A0A8J7U2C7_9BACT|nr:hypothetical protein [Acanthopleuribacter pedis]MBO1319173.1 hypothetical protein [Acanthopleuribacter pedis]
MLHPRVFTLFMFLLGCVTLSASEPLSENAIAFAPLDGALWEGNVTITIDGPLFSQYSATRMEDLGGAKVPVAFFKEKSDFKVDVDVTLQFQINDLGETSMLITNSFDGKQRLLFEKRYQYREERTIEKTNITTQELVKVMEKRETEIVYDQNQAFNRSGFDIGEVRFSSSGQMKKKGEIVIEGDLNLEFWGDARSVSIEERDPSPTEYAAVQKVATYRNKFSLPLKFSITVKHKKKPVEGAFTPEVEIVDPMVPESDVEGGRSYFSHKIVTNGSYTLTPLFAKKKK